MQVRVHVDKPVEHCYYIWLDRLNYLNWFDLISEVRTSLCWLQIHVSCGLLGLADVFNGVQITG